MNDVQSILNESLEKMVIPDGIIVINRDKKIIAFNEAAARITGYLEYEVIFNNFEFLFSNSEHDKNYFIQSLKGQTFSNIPVNIKIKSGEIKNVLSSVTPIPKGDEKAVSVVFVFRDTAEMVRLSKSLHEKTTEVIEQTNKLDAIFNSNIEGTFTINNDWQITSFNNSAEKITGFTKDEAIGKNCWQIFNSKFCRNGCHMETTMSEGKPTIGNELEIINKNGEKVPIKVNSGVLLDKENNSVGAVETFIDLTEIKKLKDQLTEQYKFENIIGKSKEMKKIFSLLESVSQTDSSVLITGESGTGKELVAHAIHLNSHRKNATFVTVNCSAFAETLIESELFGHEKGSFTGAIKTKIGKFELANSGTIFLDEIGDVSQAVQTKLLRVLESKEFQRVGGNHTIKSDVRIIAATNKNLNKEISEGRFRDDLFYRINVMNIHLPPLRDRKEDFPLLINHFINKFNKIFNKKVTGISSIVYNILLDYEWHGNIRELENVIEHAFILCKCDVIQPEHLPEKFNASSQKFEWNDSQKNILSAAEKDVIILTLKKHNGNRSETAGELGIDKSTLWRKMKKYNLK